MPSIESDDDRPPRSRDDLLEHVRGTGLRRRHRRRAAAGGAVALLLVALLLPTLGSDGGDDAQVAAGGDGTTTARNDVGSYSSDDIGAEETTTTVAASAASPTTTRHPTATTTTTAPPPPLRGEHVAFAAAVTFEQESDIWAANADGSGLRRLTTDPGREIWPTWSPDGQWIAYYAVTEGVHSHLHVMRKDGSDDRPFAGTHSYVSWAPDSRRLVLQEGDQLVILDVANGERRQLTTGTEGVWSPRGDLIAFGCGYDLCTIRPDGTSRRQLLETVYGPFSWAPDGSRLAFVHITETETSRELGLYTITAEGGDLRKLTSYSSNWLAWSPDGRKIAYGALEGLAVINADGTDNRSLGCGQDPSWAPSSRTLVVTCNPDTNDDQMYVVNADGSGRRRIDDDRFPLLSTPSYSPVTAPA